MSLSSAEELGRPVSSETPQFLIPKRGVCCLSCPGCQCSLPTHIIAGGAGTRQGSPLPRPLPCSPHTALPQGSTSGPQHKFPLVPSNVYHTLGTHCVWEWEWRRRNISGVSWNCCFKGKGNFLFPKPTGTSSRGGASCLPEPGPSSTELRKPWLTALSLEDLLHSVTI